MASVRDAAPHGDFETIEFPDVRTPLDDTGDEGPAANNEAIVTCPYCGQACEIVVDSGGGSSQSYVEDCQVCCQPWQVSVRFDRQGRALVSVSPLND